MWQPKQLKTAIENEIVRFGLEDTETNCNGLCIYEDDGSNVYAEGVLRLDGDGGGETLIDAAATLEALKAVSPTGDFEEDQQAFYDAIVEAK